MVVWGRDRGGGDRRAVLMVLSRREGCLEELAGRRCVLVEAFSVGSSRSASARISRDRDVARRQVWPRPDSPVLNEFRLPQTSGRRHAERLLRPDDLAQ